MQSAHYNDNVFINCPFDSAYKHLFDAMVFTIHDCGFIPRCALEEDDASEVRIDKIYNIIADCRYGIHDISRIQLDTISGFPRFNMPLELGIFLGAKKFGIEEQKRKRCLILDTEPYRYQQFISDIAGQDIQAHNDTSETIVKVVRDWLRNASRRETIPGGNIIWERYQEFIEKLPQTAREARLIPEELIFNDYTLLVAQWLETKGD
ncbi:MAG: hypothetical protein OXN25_18410 [Candidatus Poribacteria bacterium]|nr:hypothetical protein [Candidatus Poribacteria bacterium]